MTIQGKTSRKQCLVRRSLVASLAVLTEACALLPYAVQRRRLRRFLTDFAVVSYHVEDERALRLEVLDWLERYRDHDPDWTDGYLRPAGTRPPPDGVRPTGWPGRIPTNCGEKASPSACGDGSARREVAASSAASRRRSGFLPLPALKRENRAADRGSMAPGRGLGP